jgi:hypothetical protein
VASLDINGDPLHPGWNYAIGLRLPANSQRLLCGLSQEAPQPAANVLAHAQCDAVNANLAAAGCHPSPAQVAEGIFVAQDRQASRQAGVTRRSRTRLLTAGKSGSRYRVPIP